MSRKSVNGWTSGALIMLVVIAVTPLEVGSETVTLSTTYPSPVGIYHRLITTGSQGSANGGDTILNRDGGNTILALNNTNSFVGIGTSSPQYKLDVSGGMRLQSPNGPAMIWDAATGFLGMGTSTPQYPLHIVGPHSHMLMLESTSPGGESAMRFMNSASSNNDWEFAMQSWGFAFEYGPLGSDPIDIANNGNVGVNWNVDKGMPQYELDVAGDIHATGDVWGDGVGHSDLRLKTNVEPLTRAVDTINALNGVRYDWKDPKKYGAGKQIGVIAQDVEKVLPELVKTDKDGFKGVSYDKLTAVLIEAVKEQQKEIERLTNRIAILERHKIGGGI